MSMDQVSPMTKEQDIVSQCLNKNIYRTCDIFCFVLSVLTKNKIKYCPEVLLLIFFRVLVGYEEDLKVIINKVHHQGKQYKSFSTFILHLLCDLYVFTGNTRSSQYLCTFYGQDSFILAFLNYFINNSLFSFDGDFLLQQYFISIIIL